MLELYLVDVLCKLSFVIIIAVVFVIYGLFRGVEKLDERRNWIIFIIVWVILFVFIPLDKDTVQILVHFILGR